ncbi:Hypothetical predicted protein [Cloeon dipterum]|uniref:Uncharacterized protein n=1 Tax=Cloeon dipterum TaxID=197152 RepID=A0A8S1CA29_9INSE|nr:Hypothetical predicted protein [Cloeon dipterum]
MAAESPPRQAGVRARGQRPLSLYDNIAQQPDMSMAELGASALLDASATADAPPSQAVNLTTTVPVNLARTPLSARHQPTRASIRHSRMLVLSQQNGRVPLRYLPPVVRWHNLAAFLSTFLAVAGVIAIVVAFFLVLQAPFLLFRDLPFWSGALNLTAGLAGLILVCWCRRLAPGVPAPDWVCEANQSCIALCICFMIFSLFASVCSLVSHIIRLIWIFEVKCISKATDFTNNSTLPLLEETLANSTDSVVVFVPTDTSDCDCVDSSSGAEWPGLGCPTQRDDLVLLLLGSVATHMVAAVVILGYLLIHWRSRHYNQSVYSAVQRPVPPPIATSTNSQETNEC